MQTNIENTSFQITKNKETNSTYTIFFYCNTNNEPLIKSITKTKILLGTTTTSQYKTLTFKATSVKTLKSYKGSLNKSAMNMRYEDMLTLVKHLSCQLDFLINQYGKTFLGYNPENVIVIDENKFIYLTSDFLSNIDSKTNQITITCPFSKDDFFHSPELEKIKEIPSKVHFKTSYYSLAYLLIYTLIPNINLQQNIEQNIEKILDTLPFKDTKLYHLIKRCLAIDPAKRSILFI